MSAFTFELDTKSFFFNIENDNEKGHTATVATVLKQGNSTNPALTLFETSSSNVPLTCSGLIDECTKNSKSVVKINNLLVFDKIYLNGKKLETDAEFCLYLKEEIDPSRYQFGRIKLHYPTSLKYQDFQYSIDNREVISAISEQLHDYAFLISKIELFDEPGKINFISTLIGEKDIPYSKVFLNYKGDASRKFTQAFNEIADNYEIEAPKMREKRIPGIETIDPITYPFAYDYCKQVAISRFLQSLPENGISEVQDHTATYPYDICDIELNENGEKRYFVVYFTTTKQEYFFLSAIKSELIFDFEDEAFVILVRDVLSPNPIIDRYGVNELRAMQKELEVIKYRR